MVMKAKIVIRKDWEDLDKKLVAYVNKTDSDVEKALVAFGWYVHGRAIRILQQGPTRTGVERRGGRRSAWGEPAKSETGNLVSSLSVQVTSKGVDVGALGAKGMAPYAKYLEDENKLNRLFLEPAFNEAQPFGRKLIGKAIRKA